jgi:hypothetical protein
MTESSLSFEVTSDFLDGDIEMSIQNEHNNIFLPTLHTERTKRILLEGLHAGTYNFYLKTEKLQFSAQN